MKKTYTETVTYTGEIEAEDKDVLEEKLWVVHSLFDKPFDKFLFDAEEVQIELEE